MLEDRPHHKMRHSGCSFCRATKVRTARSYEITLTIEALKKHWLDAALIPIFMLRKVV